MGRFLVFIENWVDFLMNLMYNGGKKDSVLCFSWVPESSEVGAKHNSNLRR